MILENVLCIAEVCCDIIFGGLPKVPVLGEEEYCEEFHIKAGGGANTAIGLAKLGVPVRMHTRIGDDIPGKIIYQHMLDSGIDEKSIQLDDSVRTAVSAVMSTKADRCFASYGGDGDSFLGKNQYADLERLIQECDYVHTYLGYCIQSPILELCKRYNKPISVDSSWMDNITLEDLSALLSYCIFFTPNEKEAMDLTGTDTPQDALLRLSESIPGTILTMGEQGSIAYIDQQIYHQPCVSYGNVVDSTGAGDLYCAGLLYGLTHGYSVKECMRVAAHVSGYSVTYYGGIDKRLSVSELGI